MSEELKAALARIACLEGEIAKRDETIARLEPQLNRAIQANYDLREELAAGRVAVENCEVFRARIVELEAEVRRWVIRIQQRGLEMDDLSEELKVAHTNISGLDDLVLSLQCKVIERDAELSALKAQEPIGWYTEDHLDDKSATTYSWTVAERWVEKGWPVSPLYAAPAAPAADAGGEE